LVAGAFAVIPGMALIRAALPLVVIPIVIVRLIVSA
jgi:hypothetical protein